MPKKILVITSNAILSSSYSLSSLDNELSLNQLAQHIR